jgi:peptide-methionine (S)-S-oxide reductase
MRRIGAFVAIALTTVLSSCAMPDKMPAAQAIPDDPNLAKATFAGGCFWCMEPPFDALPGVVATISGYTGGHTSNPTYFDVAMGFTGHVEAVQVLYDPKRVRYEQLLEVFWRNVDPTTNDGQFCDRGPAYRSSIFYHDAEQLRAAETSKATLERSKKFPEPVMTRIAMATTFYPAEEYHQDFYIRNPVRYSFYRLRCGRDARLEALWGKAPEQSAQAVPQGDEKPRGGN